MLDTAEGWNWLAGLAGPASAPASQFSPAERAVDWCDGAGAAPAHGRCGGYVCLPSHVVGVHAARRSLHVFWQLVLVAPSCRRHRSEITQLADICNNDRTGTFLSPNDCPS